MISVTALTILVSLALAVSIGAIALLVVLALVDIKRGELW